REELRVNKDKWVETLRALKVAEEPIIASGTNVNAGLLTLLLSDLKSNSTLGPIASIRIVFAMLSALPFLPSLKFGFCKLVFRSKRVHYEPFLSTGEQDIPTKGIWAKAARSVQHRPSVIRHVTAVVLPAGAVGVTQLKDEGVAQSEL